MDFARIYRSPTGLIAIPATQAGDCIANQRGLTDTVFRGRPAPMVLVQAMLGQFGGDLLTDEGSIVGTFTRGAPFPATAQM